MDNRDIVRALEKIKDILWWIALWLFILTFN
jgi:hypothetical protein